MGGGTVTYTVTYNGDTSIETVQIPGPNAPKSDKLTMELQAVQAVSANAGLVQVDAFSETGAHFVSCYAEQDNIIKGTVNGLILNGLTMTVQVQVAQGEDYILNGETYSEHIKDVTLYFMDQYTGEIHGYYSSNEKPADSSPAKWSYDADTGVFTLKIFPFDPAHPEEWYYGDVLMARLTTDKKAGISAFDETVDMVYEPVSTGIAVYADPDYAPRTFDFDAEDIAGMLGVSPQTNADGELLDDNTRYSFGAFPYIGEITVAVHVFSKVFSSSSISDEAAMLQSDLRDLASLAYEYSIPETDYKYYIPNTDGTISGAETEMSGQGYTKKDTGKISAFFQIAETPYGGVRFMVGVIGTVGGGHGYNSQKNPFYNFSAAQTAFGGQRHVTGMEGNSQATKNQSAQTMAHKKAQASEFGGGYFTFSVYFGFYLDYGYIEIDKGGGAEKSHDMVFMGAGGFLGFNGNVGYTFTFVIPVVFIPAYVNFEAGLAVTFFLGATGDPDKTLASFYTEPEMHGQDFSFNFEFQGKIYLTGCIGVGLYKVIGVRASVTPGFEAGYSNQATKWAERKFDSGWGYITEVTFTGTLDLVFTSIDLYSATWPLPLADGFMYYFQEVRRGNRCIAYVRNGINDNKGSAAARQTTGTMADELADLIDSNKATTEEIKKKTYALKDYAYDNGVISWVAKNTIEMNKQGGLAGAIINGVLQDDTDTGSVSFHTNNHVNSQWVAGDGQLMSAFSAVSSEALMTDAYSQPSSQIIGIGGNRFLLVFLDDDTSRDRMQAATLKWTVYDADRNTWTEPATVQNDGTADGKPSLTDAGDKVILSWASIQAEKYETLKSQVADELEKAGSSHTNVDVQEALEADPARVMEQMDIFTVEFDKRAEKFGAITQLTDDAFYDDYPQAVYDSETKDYIVLYYKTAQDDEKYDDAGSKLVDLVSATADPEKAYSVIAYMLYNHQTDAEDTNGETHEPGWARDYLFQLESPFMDVSRTDDEGNEQVLTQKEQEDAFLERYGGQRFLPSTIRYDNGEYADPPISDLTVAQGAGGFAAYAYTVDKDFDLNTAEDRELYVQYYNFKTHGTYVPIRVAGDKTVEDETYDSESHSFVTETYTEQVEVGAPKLIRSGGDTFLFWREDGNTLKYLNVSELLSAKVAAVADPGDAESDWTYAVKDDGTFAVDAATGRTYEPRAEKVSLASLLTGDSIEITDYDVITDGDNNLYVVWTDTVAAGATEDGGMIGAQEIYASALIRQDPETVTYTDENGETETATTQTVRWSKPYRLTRDDNFNDGLALALDDQGNLFIVHNQYSKETAQSEDEMMKLISEGKIGIAYDQDGNAYAASLSYNSPVNLVITRCDKIGSLEATAFTVSDNRPVAGQTIAITAAIENVGLTDAAGSRVAFYEYKDGVRGKEIWSFTNDETIQVNTAKRVDFSWTVPEDGPEGYSIQAVIEEGKSGGGYYPAVTSYSDTFQSSPKLSLNVSDVTQEGDQFRVNFDVENSGNADAATNVSIRLVGLYGDLNSDRYGNLTNNVLYSKDISGRLPAKQAFEDTENIFSTVCNSSYEASELVTIPVSVFSYCGYDAIQVVLTDKNGNVIEESAQYPVSLDRPVNLDLNGGETVRVKEGETKQVSLNYDSTVFMEEGSVVYTVKDPTVATVDDAGNITGIKNGSTTLTATMLPSGRSASVMVFVEDECPMDAYSDLDHDAWYHDGVHWALENSVMNGVGSNKFDPNGTTSRAMIVTMLYRMEGEPESDYVMTFKDVPDGKWYTDAVAWAAENGIVNGYGNDKFGPEDKLTREQLVTILQRYANYKGIDTSAGELKPLRDFDDTRDISDWAVKAFRWAVDAGIINGTGNGKISPKMDASRAQVATMLMRYDQIAEK